MRSIIKKQLAEVNYADLSNFNKETNSFIIPKYNKPKYELNRMYLIQVAGVLVNNTDSVLASNWNNGTAPKTNYLKIYVSKIVGKMIYVDSIGFNFETKRDTSLTWTGWLPVEQITQLAVL